MIKVRCPICDLWMHGQGPKEWPQWPFCSERCKLIDLGRWLGGSYRLDSTPKEVAPAEEATKPPISAVPSAVPNREEA
jgi:endogenous inhibitor of DNA gyrase (YacG/DUF329 family)